MRTQDDTQSSGFCASTYRNQKEPIAPKALQALLKSQKASLLCPQQLETTRKSRGIWIIPKICHKYQVTAKSLQALTKPQKAPKSFSSTMSRVPDVLPTPTGASTLSLPGSLNNNHVHRDFHVPRQRSFDPYSLSQLGAELQSNRRTEPQSDPSNISSDSSHR